MIKILASSSKANAYLIGSILIDCGLPFKELQRRSDFTLSKLDLCLISHEHMDHSRSVLDLLKIGVHCAMSEGTRNALNIEHMNILIINSERYFAFKDWQILPFALQHDAAEPLGFLILTPSGKKICYVTDTAYIKYRFTGVTHWLVECNHLKKLLRENTELPQVTKDRIISSHFELENVKEFFRRQDITKTKRIYLIHLSEDNSDPPLFTKEIEQITGLPVYIS